MSLWRKVQLRRLFRVVNGGTPTSEPENWGGQVSWATPVDLGRRHGGMLGTTDRTLTEVGLRTGSGTVPGGSLVISTRAPIGYVAETQSPTAFNQGCRGLTPHASIHVRFYRYALESLNHDLQAAGQGSTFVELSSDALAQQLVAMPPLLEQRAIANFLDTETARIDALIDAKRALVDSVEARWRSDLLSRLLVADEPGFGATPWLPDSLPDGWAVAPLKRLISRCWGGDWGDEPGVAEIDLPCVRAADFEFADLRAVSGTLRSFGRAAVATRLLRPGDLVVEKSGGGEGVAVGRVVAWRGSTAAVPTNFAGGLRPVAGADYDFVLLVFRAAYEVGLPWRSIKQTTGLQNLDVGHYLAHPWVVPPVETQRRLADELLQGLSRVREVQAGLLRQVGLLQERRQALITAAVTGELQVPGVAA